MMIMVISRTTAYRKKKKERNKTDQKLKTMSVLSLFGAMSLQEGNSPLVGAEMPNTHFLVCF